MPSCAKDISREKRVKQSQQGIKDVYDYKNYVPNGNPANRLHSWKNLGAEIFYLTSRSTPEEVNDIRHVLEKYNFPDCQNLLFRKKGEEYKDVAEKLMPDILIEDDCESIGGEAEMTYPHIRPDLKTKIKSIVLKEFGGIDHLQDKLDF